MVPGFGGRLVAQSFAEQQLLPHFLNSPDAAGLALFARELSRWWTRAAAQLGPASSVRAIADVAAAPLLALLGYGAPALARQAWGLGGVAEHATAGRVVVCVLPWGAQPHAQWREAVRGGMAGAVRWALITDGRSLRIIDCARAWTKLAIEFQFAELLQDPRGVALLLALAAGRRDLAATVADCDRFNAGVCRSLGDGVLQVLPSLAASLNGSRPQALTVIYRVLFLLFAEARGLVPVWNEIYREAYTIDALCRRISEQPAAKGLWDAVQAISRMAHRGCRAGDLEVTAFNGRLFAPSHSPIAERRRIPDEIVRAMILSLATAGPRGGRRIAYHDLGVEQLGSVYERVLESPERKSTGSFYTPRSITDFVVRRTLHPLVDGKTAGQILSLRVLDPAMGSGAFLVAACQYLAEQCERARIRDGEWTPAEVTPADRARLKRQVAERCLYGVDLNPTAVQLARLSLWLTTLAAGRPLTFLDHHLAAGDSLVGARLSDVTSAPGPSRPRPDRREAPVLPLFDEEMTGLVSSRVLPDRLKLALESSDTLAIVRDKERRLAALMAPDGPLRAWHRAADVWTSLHLWGPRRPSAALGVDVIRHVLGQRAGLPAAQLDPLLASCESIARDHSVFHWELAFPEVFFDESGRPRADAGFDAVIGNPPWDMLRAGEDEPGGRGRTQRLTAFFKDSGLYRARSAGHTNRYQLFVERACQLTRHGGRFGLIVPSGIGADLGSAPLRRLLFDRCQVDTWLGFENREAIFPIHRSVRFTILGATRGGSTASIRFRCGLRRAADLDDLGDTSRDDPDGATWSVPRSRLEAWDPEGLSIPEITTRDDLAILTQLAEGNPALSGSSGWQVRFGRELNATDDRRHFFKRDGRPDALAIVEGKHLSPFQVDLSRTTHAIDRAVAARLIDRSRSFGRVRLCYRDVASATNRVTLIAALLPRDAISTHTVFCLKTPLAERDQWCLLAILNSLVANYLVRLRVTTHVTTAIMARLPVPRPDPRSAEHQQLVALARSIAQRGIDHSGEDYASLNAIVAKLYGVTPTQYEHIVSTFPLLANASLGNTEARKH